MNVTRLDEPAEYATSRSDDIPERGIDPLSPLWRQGREPWYAGLDH